MAHEDEVLAAIQGRRCARKRIEATGEHRYGPDPLERPRRALAKFQMHLFGRALPKPHELERVLVVREEIQEPRKQVNYGLLRPELNIPDRDQKGEIPRPRFNRASLPL